MHGLLDEQSAFTLLVLLFQYSLFATPAPNPPQHPASLASCCRFSPARAHECSLTLSKPSYPERKRESAFSPPK